jgi:hypothetical protein
MPADPPNTPNEQRRDNQNNDDDREAVHLDEGIHV